MEEQWVSLARYINTANRDHAFDNDPTYKQEYHHFLSAYEKQVQDACADASVDVCSLHQITLTPNAYIRIAQQVRSGAHKPTEVSAYFERYLSSLHDDPNREDVIHQEWGEPEDDHHAISIGKIFWTNCGIRT
jgi:hypothetical protein